MARNILVFLMILSYIYIQDTEANHVSARQRFKSAITKLRAFGRLQGVLKENKINCDNYETYCSQIIEDSPTLKSQSEKYQETCQERLKPHVCVTDEKSHTA